MITVLGAPAFATIQDTGRDGMRSQGVPPGGAMDQLALRAGNALLDNQPRAAAIEWALTGGKLRFDRDTRFVLTGAAADATLDERAIATNQVYAGTAGAQLTVRQLRGGRFLYVCVAGGIDVAEQLRGYGTYLPAGLGGFHGRLLRDGDMLPIGRHAGAMLREQALPPTLHSLGDDSPFAVIREPQAGEIERAAWAGLTSVSFTVGAASDRTGYRLEGLTAAASPGQQRLSEPACVGAVQLTPRGELIVLMADGPTVGGYPRIAVLASVELSRFAQLTPGTLVRFRSVGVAEARTLLAEREATIAALTLPGQKV